MHGPNVLRWPCNQKAFYYVLFDLVAISYVCAAPLRGSRGIARETGGWFSQCDSDNELRRAPISDCSSLSATCHPRLTSWKPPTWKIFGREVSSRKVETSQPNEYNLCLTVSDLMKGWSPAWHTCSRRSPEQTAGMQSNQPHLRIKG